MNFRNRKFLRYTIHALLAVMAIGVITDLNARGSKSSSGGSSRSSSGSSSRSSSGSSSKSSYGSSKTYSSKTSSSAPKSTTSSPTVSRPPSAKNGSDWGSSNTWGSSSKSVPITNSSKADQALALKVKQTTGGESATRAQALARTETAAAAKPVSNTAANTIPSRPVVNSAQDEKTKAETRLANARANEANARAAEARARTDRYDSEPSYWPSYISRRVYYRNRPLVVVYNRGYGGYGFYDSYGTWIFYNSILNQPDYRVTYVNSTNQNVPVQPTVIVQERSYFWTFFFVLIVIAAIIWGVWYLIPSRKTATTEPRQPVPPTPPQDDPKPAKNSHKSIVDVQPGDSLVLTDPQAMADAAELGYTGGLPAKVKTISTITEENNRAVWTLIRVETSKAGGEPDETQELVIMVKTVDQEQSISVLMADDVNPGTRHELIERGDNWVFQKSSKKSYEINDLKYATEIKKTWNVDNSEDIYIQKEQGELHGTVVENPVRSGISQLTATIVEYVSSRKENDNPLLVVLEIGSSKFSYVEFLIGTDIQANQVRVTN